MYYKEEEAEVNTIKDQGLSAPRKTQKVDREAVVSAWAFHWGVIGANVSYCQLSNMWVLSLSDTIYCSFSYPTNCKKSFALYRTRPATRPWKH